MSENVVETFDERVEETFSPTADDIQDYRPPLVKVRLPELDQGRRKAVVYIDQPSAYELIRFSSIESTKQRNDALFKMIARSVVTKDRQRIYRSERDVEKLKRSAAEIFPHFDRAFTELANKFTGKESGENDDDDEDFD